MQRIVIQSYPEMLNAIRREIGDMGASTEGIVFEENPEAALRQLRPDEPAIVICGQMFHSQLDGGNVAKRVKAINPQAIFLIYSAVPRWSEEVDAIIDKMYKADTIHVIAQILLSDSEDVTPTRLATRFPCVQRRSS